MLSQSVYVWLISGTKCHQYSTSSSLYVPLWLSFEFELRRKMSLYAKNIDLFFKMPHKLVFKAPKTYFLNQPLTTCHWVVHEHTILFHQWDLCNFLFLSLRISLVCSGRGSIGKTGCHLLSCTDQESITFESKSGNSGWVVCLCCKVRFLSGRMFFFLINLNWMMLIYVELRNWTWGE